MTADVLGLPSRDDGRADDTVRRAVKAIIKSRDLDHAEVARAAGISPATLYRRLGGRGKQQAFTVGEAVALAAHFEVEVTDLLTGRIDVSPQVSRGANTSGSGRLSPCTVTFLTDWKAQRPARPADELRAAVS